MPAQSLANAHRYGLLLKYSTFGTDGHQLQPQLQPGILGKIL